MATVDLRQDVLDYIKNKADHKFLRSVNALVRTYQEEDVTERDAIERYTKEIEEGIEEIEQGSFYAQGEARKIADQW